MEAVAFLESLTDGQAAKQPPLTLEQDGVVTRYWREGGRVRCREFETDGGSGVRSFEMEALHARRSSAVRFRCLRRSSGPAGFRIWTRSRRRSASGRSASERRRICWRRATPRFRLRPARVAAAGGWSGTAGPGRRSRRALGRSKSSGPTSVAATAASASANWTDAGSGGQDGHARRGEPLRGCRQFRQL